MVREAQRQARKLGHVAVVPTLDLPLSDAIHTSADGNMILGHRKARAALRLVYGRGGDAHPPEIQSAVLSPDRAAVDLIFAPVPNRLAFLGPGEHDFVVEDAEGAITVCSATTPARDRVRLELERPAIGAVRVHGGYGANPRATSGMQRRTCRSWASTTSRWHCQRGELIVRRHGSPDQRVRASPRSGPSTTRRSSTIGPLAPRRTASPRSHTPKPA